MIGDGRFQSQSPEFWAQVRLISQHCGYTLRGKGTVKVPSRHEVFGAFHALGLDHSHIAGKTRLSRFGKLLMDYFEYRAHSLNKFVEPQLMDADRAKTLFERLRTELQPTVPLPDNKQRGDKKAPAYFTGIINMLVEANAEGLPCEFDPRQLTTFSANGKLLRTFARRVDGAFPSAVNPVAIWEVKEYYYTTTFGSRVADGVYETLLDGMEVRELEDHTGIRVHHTLMLDARYTWWDLGRSYLCRIVDMLNMGLVDEVLFGEEVVSRLPTLVKEWVVKTRGREA